MICAALEHAFCSHERHWGSHGPTSFQLFRPTLLPSTSARPGNGTSLQSRPTRTESDSTSTGNWIFGESFAAPRKLRAPTWLQPSGAEKRSQGSWWQVWLVLTLLFVPLTCSSKSHGARLPPVKTRFV